MQQIYAFAKIDDAQAREKVYEEIKHGRSRFGMWDQSASLHDKWHGANSFLLKVKENDWIVHVNMPQYGKCIAVKATSEYQFDAGLNCSWGSDFNNYIPVDPASLVEFDRNDANILPSVNLAPRRRAQRILQTNDFLASLDNLKERRFDDIDKADRSIAHLQQKVGEILPQITSEIQRMNRSKEFERFLHRVFEKVPNTISAQNGFGWGTDHGADLIVEFTNPVIGINLSTKLVVQAKSYEGEHYDKLAIDQIATGIERYEGDAGLLITTATETEELEQYVRQKSEEIGKTIDVIAGTEVAKFIIRYAPELLIGK